MQEYVDAVLAFVRDHQTLSIAVVFALAFGESLAFIALLVPATIILLGVGTLIGEGSLPFLPIFLAAAIGAALGDWVSYIIGKKFDDRIAHMWPLSRKPDLLARAHRFFGKWGVLSVFLGRFFGPIRAVIPLVAGICDMPFAKFQAANFTSAFIWAFGVLAPGAFGIKRIMGW